MRDGPLVFNANAEDERGGVGSATRDRMMQGMQWGRGGAVKFGVIALLVGVAAAIAIWQPWRMRASADADDPRLVAEGRAIYAEHCASCHGNNLEGQANWQKRLPNGRLPAPPHDASGHTWHHSDRQLFELTTNGVSGIVPGYESDMPAFKSILSDKRIWAVIAFIKNGWPKEVRSRQEQLNQNGK
jgi:mono/diheme cytochrome c family protein